MNPTDNAKSLEPLAWQWDVAAGSGAGAPCGLRPPDASEVLGAGGLKTLGAEKAQKARGGGAPCCRHHSGIFHIALFPKGIAQSPAADSTIRKRTQFRSCGIRSPVGAA